MQIINDLIVLTDIKKLKKIKTQVIKKLKLKMATFSRNITKFKTVF